MAELKRLPVKYIRDLIKREYKPRDFCFICGATDTLELHHIYSLSQLWELWCKENNIGTIETVEEITDLRVKFQADNIERLSNKHLYTLCKVHHERLHNLYGQNYALRQDKKVLRWISIQKEKYSGSVE